MGAQLFKVTKRHGITCSQPLLLESPSKPEAPLCPLRIHCTPISLMMISSISNTKLTKWPNYWEKFIVSCTQNSRQDATLRTTASNSMMSASSQVLSISLPFLGCPLQTHSCSSHRYKQRKRQQFKDKFFVHILQRCGVSLCSSLFKREFIFSLNPPPPDFFSCRRIKQG